MQERKNLYRVLVGKPEGRRPLGGPRCGWEDNIELYLKVIEWGGCRLDRFGSVSR